MLGKGAIFNSGYCTQNNTWSLIKYKAAIQSRASADVINNKSTARGISEWQSNPEIELQLRHSVCGSVLLFVIDGK